MKSKNYRNSATGGFKPNDSKTLAKSAAINVIGLFAKISRTLFTFMVTKLWGPGIFGSFTIVTAFIDLVSRLTIFGMDKSLLKFIPEKIDQAEQYHVLSCVSRVALILSMIVILLTYALADSISKTWLGRPDLAQALQIMAISILPLTLLNLLLSATKALKVMKYDVYVMGIIHPGLLILCAIPVIWFHDTLLGLSLAYSVAAFGAMFSAFRFFQKHFSLRRLLSAEAGRFMPQMLAFSTPLGLHDFVQYAVLKLEIFLLAYFVPVKEVGIYALAAEVAFVMKRFRQVFDPILIPLISEIQSQESTMERIQENVARVIRWILYLAVPYACILILFGKSILNMFGSEFEQGAFCLIFLSIAHLVNANSGLLDSIMMVSGRPKINLLNAFILLITQASLSILFIPSMGILGAAVGSGLSLVLIALVRLIQSFLILKLNPFNRTQLKPIYAGVFAGILSVLCQEFYKPSHDDSLIWVGFLLLFIGTYVVVVNILGLGEEDKYILQKVFKIKK